MPVVTGRQSVLDVYAEAAERQWVIPTINTECQTSTEAILAAAAEFAAEHGIPDLPVGIGLTNLYLHRPQAPLYTHTGLWQIGMRMFLNDLDILTGPDSPFHRLRVLVNLDHIQWDADRELLEWDLRRFSSIMYDASLLPFEENIRMTARFREERGEELVIEGACDEIREASEEGSGDLTTPEMAERYVRETGVDIIVANLGTEHRASAAELTYHGDLAREITRRVGRRLCLHGTSSVPHDQVRRLFHDGVVKVNIWTAIERDSSPALLEDMARNAARVAGTAHAARLQEEGLLGPAADTSSPADLRFFTTAYRQGIVFREMKRIVKEFLELWYC